MKKINRLTMALAVIYLVLLVWIIVMKLSTFSDLYEIAHIRSVNFIPFFYNCENDVHLLEVIINIVVFIPIGIYLRILGLNSKRIIIYGSLLSLTFEAVQFVFGIGSADITDLITNTAGTAVGTLVYSMLATIFKNKDRLNKVLSYTALACTTVLIITCLMYAMPSKADPIVIPNDEDIASIEVIYGDAKGKIAEQEQISVISGMLKEGQSTRIQSVNDTPPSEYNYFTVRLFDKNGDWDDVFVYSDGNSIYIEQPYQGVYKSDKELIEVLNSITVKEN